MAQNYVPFYLFIAILCAKYPVCTGPKGEEKDFLTMQFSFFQTYFKTKRIFFTSHFSTARKIKKKLTVIY